MGYISIHSPHARGDSSSCVVIVHQDYFNPLPSCEGRLGALDAEYNPIEFQSTPLMRGETIHNPSCHVHDAFQSTPLMRGETTIFDMIGGNNNFNPLPSCEGRPERDLRNSLARLFQSTPLMRGETRHFDFLGGFKRFQSTPLMRGETA